MWLTHMLVVTHTATQEIAAGIGAFEQPFMLLVARTVHSLGTRALAVKNLFGRLRLVDNIVGHTHYLPCGALI